MVNNLVYIAPDDNCSDFDVRLVGGNNTYMGRVEACYSNDTHSSLWGPLCAEGFAVWNIGAAVTVCGQLGLPTESKKSNCEEYNC